MNSSCGNYIIKLLFLFLFMTVDSPEGMEKFIIDTKVVCGVPMLRVLYELTYLDCSTYKSAV